LPVFDAEGRVAGPALVDMHIHGCGGVDASEGDIAENLVAMAAFLEERGITSFQPATVMREGVLKGFKDAFDCRPGLLRTIPGVYLEGPFIDADRRGGIPLTGVAAFSEGRLDSILGYRSAGRPVVKTMSIAPELAGSDVAARMLKAHGVVPAWGHSGAFAGGCPGFDC
jgi:N-acetylglucosamine-6-phosphate deacetylase